MGGKFDGKINGNNPFFDIRMVCWQHQVCVYVLWMTLLFDLEMGCCNSGQVKIACNSFDQAWQFFKSTDLARPECFSQNRQRVFRFLFLSIILPQTKQTRDRVCAFGKKLPKESRAFGEVRVEIARLDEELVELQAQKRTLHQDFAKRIKSDLISVEEGRKFLTVHDQRMEEEKMDPRGDSHAVDPFPIPPLKQSVSEIHQSLLRSSYESYSIPLTAMDSMLDPRNSEVMPRADSRNSHSRSERLLEGSELQSDKKKALGVQVEALGVQLEQQKGELVRLEDTRTALLKELDEKQEIIEKLKNQQVAVRLQEEIIEIRRDKEEMGERVAQMQLQLEQFRGEVARLDREREEALSEKKYLSVKVKDLGDSLCQTTYEESNISPTILPQLLPSRKAVLSLFPCVVQERVEPSSRFSVVSKLDHSFIILEEQGEEQGEGEGKAEKIDGYNILFNLFPNSKVLPSHADFQAAVGKRTIIADLFQHRPLKSQLLFSFDPITPNHFAKYIQNLQNLLLLVGLPNGITLGGFAGNFTGQNELTESFLFSLDPHREPMKLTPAPGRKVRRIDIDPGQLVFGNGELRVRAKSLEVGSSVGCFQSLFCWGKRAVPVEKFLGTSERTLMATAYEIHQLHFA